MEIKNKKTYPSFLLLIVVSFLIFSCGKTEKDIDVKKALEYQVNKESKGLLELEEFELIKGEKKASDNKMAYLVSYKAKLKAKEELEFGQSMFEPLSRYISITPEQKKRSLFQPPRLLGKKILKEGDTTEVKFDIMFWKVDEENWQDQYGNLY